MRSELNCKTNCQYNFSCGACFSNGCEPGVTCIERHSKKLSQKIQGEVAHKPTISAVDRGTVELGNRFYWLRAGTLVRK